MLRVCLTLHLISMFGRRTWGIPLKSDTKVGKDVNRQWLITLLQKGSFLYCFLVWNELPYVEKKVETGRRLSCLTKLWDQEITKFTMGSLPN